MLGCAAFDVSATPYLRISNKGGVAVLCPKVRQLSYLDRNPDGKPLHTFPDCGLGWGHLCEVLAF